MQTHFVFKFKLYVGMYFALIRASTLFSILNFFVLDIFENLKEKIDKIFLQMFHVIVPNIPDNSTKFHSKMNNLI